MMKTSSVFIIASTKITFKFDFSPFSEKVFKNSYPPNAIRTLFEQKYVIL